jgi:hypothetical protein
VAVAVVYRHTAVLVVPYQGRYCQQRQRQVYHEPRGRPVHNFSRAGHLSYSVHMPLHGCVVCSTSPWHGMGVRQLVEMMGGRYSSVADADVTHVVGARITHRHHVACAMFPELTVLHPSWVWACYWRDEQVPTERYELDFVLAAQRTGTSTKYGTRAQFNAEVAQYQRAEMRTAGMGTTLARVLRLPQYARSRHWPFVCRVLLPTRFWGPIVRDANWARRRALLMGLRHRRVAGNGPLARTSRLPPALQRLILLYC